MAARRIRVLIVDENDLFRVGLASMLAASEDLDVVAQAPGGRMGIRLASELRPDVVLMDLRMSDPDGFEATRAILERNDATRIVALTVLAGESDVTGALHAGVCGYLLKDSPIGDVAAAIRAAANGTAWLSPRAALALLDHLRSENRHVDRAPASVDALSSREIQVLKAVARGLSNSEISAELSISPATAKNHVSSILSKLGVRSRLEAAMHAARSDMLDDESGYGRRSRMQLAGPQLAHGQER